MPPVNASVMRQVNRQLVLSAIRRHGPVSRSELGHLTGLSPPAITGIVRELIRMDLVREVGAGRSSGGRPPILLTFNPSAQCVLAANLEGQALTVAVADLSGQVLEEQAARVDTDRPSAAVRTLVRLLDELTQRHGGRRRLAAVGIAVPGITHVAAGTVSHAPALGWWQEVPLRDRVRRHFRVPVVVENDVNLMTLGEHAQGAGQGVDNLVLIHVGIGIGAGILIGGKLYRGARGAAGEVGYLPLGPADTVQPFRTSEGYGLFEERYSARGLALRVRQVVGNLPADVGPDRVVAHLCECARMAIPWAQALLEDAIRHWAYSVAAVASILDPDRILLGGQIEQIGQEGLLRIREYVERLVPVPPELSFGTLGARGALVGAAALALEAIYGHPPATPPESPGHGPQAQSEPAR